MLKNIILVIVVAGVIYYGYEYLNGAAGSSAEDLPPLMEEVE
jgi:hypothetical protein